MRIAGLPAKSRRRLLTGGLAAAMVAATGLPAQALGRSGGRLVAGLSGGAAADSWDGRSHDGLFMQAVSHGAVHDCLTEVAADGTLRGELAVGWDASADARDWRFELRPGVRFHDGTPLTATDVVASLSRHRTGSPMAPLLAEMQALEAASPGAVRIALREGNPDLPYLLSDPHLVIQPEAAPASGIGTGLYRVAVFEPGARFVGRRVAEHWKDGQAGWADEVEMLALDPLSARLAALRSGRVDVIDGLGATDAVRLAASADRRVIDVAANPEPWRMALSDRVGAPAQVGALGAMDSARFAERWWVG